MVARWNERRLRWPQSARTSNSGSYASMAPEQRAMHRASCGCPMPRHCHMTYQHGQCLRWQTPLSWPSLTSCISSIVAALLKSNRACPGDYCPKRCVLLLQDVARRNTLLMIPSHLLCAWSQTCLLYRDRHVVMSAADGATASRLADPVHSQKNHAAMGTAGQTPPDRLSTFGDHSGRERSKNGIVAPGDSQVLGGGGGPLRRWTRPDAMQTGRRPQLSERSREHWSEASDLSSFEGLASSLPRLESALLSPARSHSTMLARASVSV